MKFSRKVFLTIFATSLATNSAILWTLYSFTHADIEETFFTHYQTFTEVLADTLLQMERNTDLVMAHAGRIFQNEDRRYGLLSEGHLKRLAKELKVTHLFVTDKDGNFIRSTNEDPSKIPNLFKFCSDYPKILTGSMGNVQTPMIPPFPEPKPHKFFIMANHDNTRFLEVGMIAEFIGATMSKALAADKNLLSLELYAPDGTSLGTYSTQGASYHPQGTKSNFDPKSFLMPKKNETAYSFLTRVDASITQCCQCDAAGLSRSGHYYYILKANICDKELTRELERIRDLFILFQGLAAGFSIFLARVLSHGLVKRIQYLGNRVKKVISSKKLSTKVKVMGNDEISQLSEDFNLLMKTLDESQEKLLTAERAETRYAVAEQVAHDIRSPLLALKVAAQQAEKLKPQMRELVLSAIAKINEITRDLNSSEIERKGEVANQDFKLKPFLERLVRYKRKEARFYDIDLKLQFSEELEDYHLTIDQYKFDRVLSNLINNAIEASKPNGVVEIFAEKMDGKLTLKIIDQGKGIPDHILEKLGQERISYGKVNGNGLGVFDAFRFFKANGFETTYESNAQGTCCQVRTS